MVYIWFHILISVQEVLCSEMESRDVDVVPSQTSIYQLLIKINHNRDLTLKIDLKVQWVGFRAI